MAGRVLLQVFHWYTPGGGVLWPEVAARAPDLAAMGITDVWLPPAGKGASGGASVGYDVYDLFDLGEFDQKGGVATKYGDRAALDHATRALRDNGLGVIVDVVFNHRMGADETERAMVQPVNPEDRTETAGDAFEATVWTRFTFPGRQRKYSDFIWTADCFGGVDHIEAPDGEGVFRLITPHGGAEWADEVDAEKGNFDYLMGADVEFRNPAVCEELKYWGHWIAGQIPLTGFRLDAAKHIPAWFFRDWVGHMRETVGRELFVVAEYWHPDLEVLTGYLGLVDRQLAVFDVALQHNFSKASRAGEDCDMRDILAGSLVAAVPDHAVTLVANHDTQPLQALESPVETWFKPLAYALILLREQGVPCVFYPDLFGAEYTDTGNDGAAHQVVLPPIADLPALIAARARFANGPQTDLFDDPHCIAFIRHGTAEAPGCVVVLTNAGEGAKEIDLGPDLAGRSYRDVMGHQQAEVVTDDAGRARFSVGGGSVSVWVLAELP